NHVGQTVLTPVDGTVSFLSAGYYFLGSYYQPVGPSFTPSSALADGPHTFVAKFTDYVGNVSDVSTALTVTIDTTAPAPGELALDLASNTGLVPGDNLTNLASPTVTGTAEA